MLAAVAGAQSEPLGDYARSIRKEGKGEVGKKYDNDNFAGERQDQRRGNARDRPAPKMPTLARLPTGVPPSRRTRPRPSHRCTSSGQREEGGI